LAHGTGRQSGVLREKKRKKRDWFPYGRIRARARA